MTRPPAAIVVAPPWSTGGSTNLFSAQIKAYADSGRRVLLLLGPTNKWQTEDNAEFWTATLGRMAFPGTTAVNFARIRPRKPLDGLRRLARTGLQRASTLSQIARTAAEASLGADALDFITRNHVDIIHVNHAFEVLLGERIAAAVEHSGSAKPALICETHDIQSVALARHASESHVVRNADTKDEEDLYRRADFLLHCAPDDLDFFKARLPESRHYLHLPTIKIQSESELRQIPSRQPHRRFDYLYIGDEHVSNFKSLAWLLKKVFPLLEHSRDLVCVGRISEMVRKEDAGLFKAFRSCFRGQVDDILEYYEAAKVVLVPSFEGTGTSIKLVEALCSGKPIVATSNALRGLPPGCKSETLFEANTPQDFASAMRKALRLATNAEEAGVSHNRAIYDEWFSNAAYSRRMAGFIDMFAAQSAAAPPRSP